MASIELPLHPPRYRGSTLLMAVVNTVQALMLPFIFLVAMFPSIFFVARTQSLQELLGPRESRLTHGMS